MSTVTIQQVNTAIMFGDFTNDQLNSIISAVKFRRAELTRANKRSLTIGTKVRFVSSRSGQAIVGTVEKVAIKFVTVRDPVRGLWKVPASMLETV